MTVELRHWSGACQTQGPHPRLKPYSPGRRHRVVEQVDGKLDALLRFLQSSQCGLIVTRVRGDLGYCIAVFHCGLKGFTRAVQAYVQSV